MTSVDTASPPASAVEFLGSERAYWQLRIKGAALVMVTLGLYRFWLATDVRRFLWSNTEIDGETLEYNGLATELLGGFLLAITILAPVYATIAMTAIALGATQWMPAAAGLVLVTLFGEFARYRARRYRLTRTVFRGVRFDQHGSAWRYAFYAFAWWCLIIASFGVAYPWAQASLQRFMMRRTSFGDLDGRFAGTGLSLFLRGLPLWLLVVGPVIATIVALVAQIDWDALSGAIDHGDNKALGALMGTASFQRLVGIGLIGICISGLAAALLYPLFQSVLMRWWISGIRFGEVSVTSRLRTGRVYRIYVRFVLYLMLFMLIALIAATVGLGVVGVLVGPRHDSAFSELSATAIAVGVYAVIALGVSTLHQVLVTFAMWRAGAQSAELSNAEALGNVRAIGAPSSALGEGLADALGFGGI